MRSDSERKVFPGDAGHQFRRHKRQRYDPWVGKIDPFQCPCLENPMDRGAWQLPSVESQRVRHD